MAKITREKIQEIIKEEIKGVLSENYGPSTIFWVGVDGRMTNFDDIGTAEILVPVAEMSVAELRDALNQAHKVAKFGALPRAIKLLGMGLVDGGAEPIDAFIFAQID